MEEAIQLAKSLANTSLEDFYEEEETTAEVDLFF